MADVQHNMLANVLGSFVDPDQHNESSMLKEVPTTRHVTDDDVPVTYQIVPTARNRGMVIISLFLNIKIIMYCNCSSNTGLTEMT